jgi:hypothetical protein
MRSFFVSGGDIFTFADKHQQMASFFGCEIHFIFLWHSTSLLAPRIFTKSLY